MSQIIIKKNWISCLSFGLIAIATFSIDSCPIEAKPNFLESAPSETTISQTTNKDELYTLIEQIAVEAKGRVGVAATVLETGESVTFNGDQRFVMQSVYKFPIAMAVLAEVDRGKITLSQKIRVETADFANLQYSPMRDAHPQGGELTVTELLRLMVSESDNTACDLLLRMIGGPQAAQRYLATLGINNITVANTEKEIGQDNSVQYKNWATPEATVTLLKAFHEGRGLSKSSQALLLQMMIETSTGPRRIKGLLPQGTIVAHKTGTSGTVEGITAATNDVGLVTLANGKHLAIAVFVSDSKADDITREKVIAKVARAVWDQWSQ